MSLATEHLAVEGDSALVVAGVQLEPARCARLAEEPEALVETGLPHTYSGAAWVADIRSTQQGAPMGAASRVGMAGSLRDVQTMSIPSTPQQR
ncbi:MAG: hypothetical protein ACRDQU_04245 [Pseudonocardiaceae bacterium]